MTQQKPILEIKNLKKHFTIKRSFFGKPLKTVHAVDGINLKIYKGETFGLVGESGCGKSTTGRTIVKLYDSTDGEIIYEGKRFAAGYASLIGEIKHLKQEAFLANKINHQPSYGEKYKIQREYKNKVDALRRKLALYKKDPTKVSEVASLRNEIQSLKENTINELSRLKTKEVKERDRKILLENKEKQDTEIKKVLSESKPKIEALNIDLKNAKEDLDNKNQVAKIQKELQKALSEAKRNQEQEIENLKTEYQKKIKEIKNEIYKILHNSVETEKMDALKKEIKSVKKNALQERKNLTKTDRKNKDKEVRNKLQALKKEMFIRRRALTKKVRDNKYLISNIKKELRNKLMKAKLNEIQEIQAIKSNYKQTLTQVDKVYITQLKIKDLNLEVKNAISEIKNPTWFRCTQRIKTLQKEIHARKKDASHKNKGLKKKIQMIFQDPYASLNPRMTVTDIIGEGIETHKLYAGRAKQERIYQLLEQVGLKREHASRYPHEFSGGQRQRIGIARALAVNPDIIICDEPISALDVSIQAQVVNMLEDLQKEYDLTYLFIAHDLSMVKYISDRIGVMYLGKLMEVAESDALYETPLHPYTKALLSSIPLPDPEANRQREHMPLEGEVTSPINPKPTCRFSGRCKYAKEKCHLVEPELVEILPNRFVACHYVKEINNLE